MDKYTNIQGFPPPGLQVDKLQKAIKQLIAIQKVDIVPKAEKQLLAFCQVDKYTNTQGCTLPPNPRPPGRQTTKSHETAYSLLASGQSSKS